MFEPYRHHFHTPMRYLLILSILLVLPWDLSLACVLYCRFINHIVCIKIFVDRFESGKAEEPTDGYVFHLRGENENSQTLIQDQ